MLKTKLIKSKAFTFQDTEGKDVKGVVHTVAYKGRALNINTINFEDKDISIVDKVLTINAEVDVVRDKYIDALGIECIGLKIMPKMDLVLSDF